MIKHLQFGCKSIAEFELVEKLNSTKSNSSGIGLSVVKKIITSCGGNVWINDSNHGGTEIVFSILQHPNQ